MTEMDERTAPSPAPQPRQITLKTVFTICFGVLFVAVLVTAFVRALLVLCDRQRRARICQVPAHS